MASTAKMSKKEMKKQNNLRSKEAAQLKEALILKMNEQAAKEEKRIQKQNEERQKVEMLKQNNLLEQAAMIIPSNRNKKKSSASGISVQTNPSGTSQQFENFKSSNGRNVKPTSDLLTDDVWDEIDATSSSGAFVNDIWDEVPAKTPSGTPFLNDIWEEENIQSAKAPAYERPNTGWQNRETGFQKDRARGRGGGHVYTNNKRGAFKGPQRTFNRKNDNRNPGYAKQKYDTSQKNTRYKPQAEHIKEESNFSYERPIDVVDAPIPKVNVWAQRLARNEEIERMIPHNEAEEERMMQAVLEMSKTEVLKEQRQKQEVHNMYLEQLKFMAQNPDTLPDLMDAAEVESVPSSAPGGWEDERNEDKNFTAYTRSEENEKVKTSHSTPYEEFRGKPKNYTEKQAFKPVGKSTDCQENAHGGRKFAQKASDREPIQKFEPVKKNLDYVQNSSSYQNTVSYKKDEGGWDDVEQDPRMFQPVKNDVSYLQKTSIDYQRSSSNLNDDDDDVWGDVQQQESKSFCANDLEKNDFCAYNNTNNRREPSAFERGNLLSKVHESHSFADDRVWKDTDQLTSTSGEKSSELPGFKVNDSNEYGGNEDVINKNKRGFNETNKKGDVISKPVSSNTSALENVSQPKNNIFIQDKNELAIIESSEPESQSLASLKIPSIHHKFTNATETYAPNGYQDSQFNDSDFADLNASTRVNANETGEILVDNDCNLIESVTNINLEKPCSNVLSVGGVSAERLEKNCENNLLTAEALSVLPGDKTKDAMVNVQEWLAAIRREELQNRSPEEAKSESSVSCKVAPPHTVSNSTSSSAKIQQLAEQDWSEISKNTDHLPSYVPNSMGKPQTSLESSYNQIGIDKNETPAFGMPVMPQPYPSFESAGCPQPGLINPAATLAWQQMMMSSNPFLMQQLYNLQMFYLSMGLPAPGTFSSYWPTNTMAPPAFLGETYMPQNALHFSDAQNFTPVLPGAGNGGMSLEPSHQFNSLGEMQQDVNHLATRRISTPPGINASNLQPQSVGHDDRLLNRPLSSSNLSSQEKSVSIPPPVPARVSLQNENLRQPRHKFSDLYSFH